MKNLLNFFTLLLAILIFSVSNLAAVTLIDEDFESWPATGWQVVDHTGNGSWTNHNAIHAWNNYINADKPFDEKGDVVVAEGHDDFIIDTSLIAPPIDLTDNSYIVLYYETVYSDAHWLDDYVDIDVSTNGGNDWITVLHWEDVDVVQHGPGTNIVVNISVAAGCPNALVRFHYYSPAGGYWWEIDNVKIVAGTINPTDFKAEAVTKNQIDLSWMTNEVGDEVIIARNLSDNFGTPTDGTVYNVGNNIGASSIIYKGNEVEYSDSDTIFEATEYFYKIWAVNSETQYSAGVSANALTCIGTFPYMESFESDIGGWLNIKDNDFDWRRHSGTTASSLTGPDSGANGSSYYIYTEATNPGNPFKPFLIETSFDFISSPNPELAFFYHMYGEEMGRLHVDVCDDSGNWHSNLWEISGQQQTASSDPWKQAIVEMQQFGGQSPVKIRFRGVTGIGNISDMAVDYITITNRPGGMFFTPGSQSKSGNFGTTVQYEINALNLIGVGSDFNLTYTGFGGGAGWNEVGPANTGFINYRTSTNITVNVTVDPNAAANEAHTSIVTSVSTDGIFTNNATIITKCDWNYEIYSEGFQVEDHLENGWPNGWTNYFLGQTNNLGWFHGIDRYALYWWPTHDPAYGATNWFVSPPLDFSAGANQIYLTFYFAYDGRYLLTHTQSVYISTGSRNPNDGDYVKVSNIDYADGADWLRNLVDLSAFHGNSNVHIAIDYTSGNPLIAFDNVEIFGYKTGVDNAAIISPTSFIMDSYQSIPAVTGAIAIAGSTGVSGPATQVTAQFGYGFKNTNPFDDPDWIWLDAVYSGSNDTSDLFSIAPFFLSIAGEFDYSFRFKNGESGWIYADNDGSSNGYKKTAAGKMTVNMFAPKGKLIKEQTLPENFDSAFYSFNSPIYNYAAADDFEFTVDTVFESIRWKSLYWGTGRAGNETGVVLKVYSNNSSGGDHPGSELYSELVPGYSCEQFMKKDGIYNLYKYHIDLPSPFTANKNTKYWFSVQMKTADSNEYWGPLTTLDPISGQSAMVFNGNSWGIQNADFGFELYGSATNTGILMGSVSSAYNGFPLANVDIKINDGTDIWVTSTDANGEYNILIPLGAYNVSAELYNYQTETIPNLSIDFQSQVKTQNFVLDGSKLYYSPSAISNSMNFGYVVTNKVILTNDGPITLSYNLNVISEASPALKMIAEKDSANLKTSPIVLNYDLETIFNNSIVSPLPALDNFSFPSTTISRNKKSSNPFNCYAVDLYYAPATFVNFNSSAPGTFSTEKPLAIDPSELICAGDFILGDFSSLYAITLDGRELVKISTADANVTSLGILYPATENEIWTGMTAAQNGDVYGVTADGTKSQLYTIDIKTCSATLIGTIPSQQAVIDIAINTKGELFGIEILNDILIKINPDTLAVTIVGNIGIDANYAQGLDFNDLDDSLYYASYATNTGGVLLQINTDTAETTSLGTFKSGHNIDAFAIPLYKSPDWVSIIPNSGTIPPDSTTQIDVIFDASTISNFGTFTSEIAFYGSCINSVPKLPLTLELLPSPILTVPMTQNFGEVEMYFTSSVPLIVGNTGVGVLTGTVQNLAAPFFVAGDSNYFIQASSNITLNTFFVSDVEGNFSQNVLLSGGGGKTVVFTGNAIPEPILFINCYLLFIIYYRRKLISF